MKRLTAASEVYCPSCKVRGWFGDYSSDKKYPLCVACGHPIVPIPKAQRTAEKRQYEESGGTQADQRRDAIDVRGGGRLMLRLSEAAFQAQVIQLATLCGWLAYHTRDSRGSAGGFPDLVLVHPTRRRVVYAELKSERGKVKPDQIRWIEALQSAGQNAHIWRPRHWPIIERYLKGEV